jgi:hypothetical protein
VLGWFAEAPEDVGGAISNSGKSVRNGRKDKFSFIMSHKIF